MLQFEFQGVERDVATLLSQDFRRKLIQRGAAPQSLSLVRGDANDMDVGSILEILSSVDILATIEKGLTIATIAHCLYELIHREKVIILVKGPDKTVRLGPSSISSEVIEEAIKEVTHPDERRT